MAVSTSKGPVKCRGDIPQETRNAVLEGLIELEAEVVTLGSGVSRESIRQIETKALNKLEKVLSSNKERWLQLHR